MSNCSRCKKERTDDDVGLKTCLDCRKQRVGYNRNYYIKNKEQVLESKKAYRENNLDMVKEYQRLYREKNREALNIRGREFRAKVKELLKS